MKKLSKKQFSVLLGAALYQSALLGVWINVTGVFLAKIREEYDFTVTHVSSYYTIKSVATMVLGAVLAKAFFKTDKKRFMAIVITTTIASALLLVIDAGGGLWYLSAALACVTQGTSMIMVPYTLNPWFKDKAGTATGIAMGASGLSGALVSSVVGRVISVCGWRRTIVLLCVLMAGLAAAGLYLMFRDSPESAGTYDEQKAIESRKLHFTVHRDTKKFPAVTFLLCSVMFTSATMLMQFTQYFSIYAVNIGYALTLGATMTSLNMIGNTVGKFLFGMLETAIGIWPTTIASFGALLFAGVCFLFFPGSIVLLYLSALLYGVVFALVNVGISRCSIAAYGEASSQGYVGLHVSVNNAVSAVYTLILGTIVDASQNFTPVLIIGMTLCISSICSAFALSKVHKNKEIT